MKPKGPVRVLTALCLALAVLAWGQAVPAAQQTLELTVPGPVWYLDDNPPPKTYWAPWYPVPTQAVVRYRMGFQFSTGSVAVRCPVKVTLRWNDAEARGGKTLHLHVKAEPAPALGSSTSQRTFDAGFGVGLPTQLQVGFVSITGLPDILPWKNLPLDVWQLIALIPEVGGTISSAVSNVGVYMDSGAACPLGDSSEFHDERELISLDLKDLITDADTEGKPKDLATRLWNQIPGPVKTVVKNGIKAADWVNDQTAQTRAIDLLADGLDLVTSAGELSLSADPYWRVRGEKLMVLIRYHIPGRMLSGTMPLYFTGMGQEQTLEIPLPAFVNDDDHLEVLVDEAEYAFKLFQSMTAQVTFSSMVNISLGETEKLVRYPQARAEFTSGNSLAVPLAATDETIVDYRARSGYKALQVYFSSPAMPVKATVEVYKGSQKVKSVTESGLRTAHAIIVPGLAEDTAYTVRLSYVDSGGNSFTHDQTVSCRTKKGTANVTFQTETSNSGRSISTPSVSSTQTSASFSWTSSHPGSTFVYLSPLADFNLYTSAIKHVGGQVSVGDCTSVQGQAELTTSHSITVPGLNPGTTYYYVVRNWFYYDDDPTKDPRFALTYRGSFNTQAAPPPPQAVVQLMGWRSPLAGQPVTVVRTSPAPVETLNLVTGSDGKTPVFALTPGGHYQASVADLACVQDGSITWTAPSSTGSGPSTKQLVLTARPQPGVQVLDSSGNPISGAQIFMGGNNNLGNTNSSGVLRPNGQFTTSGPTTLTVSKTGYLTRTVDADVDDCGMLTADTCVLVPNSVQLTASVYRADGSPASGVPVSLCQANGSGCQSLGTTNSQGLADTTFTFTANQTQTRLLKATPQGNLATTYQATEQEVTLAPGQDASADMSLPLQPPPEVSAFSARQEGSLIKVQVSSPSLVFAALEYTGPGGLAVDQPFPTTNNAQDHTRQITGCGSGEYQVRAKIKNAAGRTAVSEWQTVRYWSAAEWELHALQTEGASAVLAWTPYQGSGTIKNYVLTVNGQNPVRISGTSNTEKKLENLPLGQPLTVGLHAEDKTGETISETGQTTITLVNQPPVINEVVMDPQVVPVGQKARLMAVVSDPDTKLNVTVREPGGKALYTKNNAGSPLSIKVNITGSKAGTQHFVIQAGDGTNNVEATADLKVVRIATPVIKTGDVPRQVEVLQDWTAELKVANREQLPETLTLNIAWDDGERQAVTLGPSDLGPGGEFQVTRSFEEPGARQAELTLTAEAQGLSFTSKPVKLKTKAVLNPPQAALTCSGQGATRTFHVTATPGSLDIERWTLNFGDGGLPVPVTGPADTEVSHTYNTVPGQKPLTKATATLTVRDVRGNETVATARVSGLEVPPSSRDDQPEAGVAQSREEESAKEESTVEADLLLSASLPSKVAAGQEKNIKVVVKNRSKTDLERIQVVMRVNDADVETQELDLLAGKSGELHFAFIPQEPGQVGLEFEALPPKGVTDPKPSNNTAGRTVKVTAPTN